ncbi:MAG: DoxX family protein [Candidatus Pacearchaeota archaeon]|nr:DoxX family protein [Candidatus Pacearchaeota archaeon]
MEMKNLKTYSKPLLRISLSFLFLYFSIQQFIAPESWISFVPDIALSLGFTAKTLVLLNAFFELFFGVLLIIGLYTRFSSLVLALHLFGIAFSIGFNPLGMRDLALALATFSVFLNGPDRYCIDFKMQKSKIRKSTDL